MTKSVLVWSAVSVALLLIPAGNAQAETVSKGIAKTLQSAQNASKARKWSACLGDLKQAEGSGGLSAYDNYIINELRGFCAFSSATAPPRCGPTRRTSARSTRRQRPSRGASRR